MKILAIDSSGLAATVALLCDGILTGEYTIHNKKTHSQTLLPMIHDMLQMAEVDVKELDGIAVAAGPGSFTGLRIGAATAKGLAQTLAIPIVAVPALEGLAFNVEGTEALACPIMDARRNQVYYGIYNVKGECPEVIENQSAAPIEEVIEKLNELGRDVVFIGDGVPVFRNQLKQTLKVPFRFGADSVLYQRASSVAALGKFYFEKNCQMEAKDFAPVYLRMSQAERERMERKGK